MQCSTAALTLSSKLFWHKIDRLPGAGVQEVESKFDKFGPVKEARIVRNPVNGESRGFGFVSMKYEEDVDAVSAFARSVFLSHGTLGF